MDGCGCVGEAELVYIVAAEIELGCVGLVEDVRRALAPTLVELENLAVVEVGGIVYTVATSAGLAAATAPST